MKPHACPRCRTLIFSGRAYCAGCSDLFFVDRATPATSRDFVLTAATLLVLALIGLHAIVGDDVEPVHAPRSLAPRWQSPGAIQPAMKGE